MVQTQVELTEEQVKVLEEIAQRRHMPLSALIREGIVKLLRSETSAHLDTELKQRALAIAGRYRSGLGDLSRHHDKYLAEASDS